MFRVGLEATVEAFVRFAQGMSISRRPSVPRSCTVEIQKKEKTRLQPF